MQAFMLACRENKVLEAKEKVRRGKHVIYLQCCLGKKPCFTINIRRCIKRMTSREGYKIFIQAVIGLNSIVLGCEHYG